MAPLGSQSWTASKRSRSLSAGSPAPLPPRASPSLLPAFGTRFPPVKPSFPSAHVAGILCPRGLLFRGVTWASRPWLSGLLACARPFQRSLRCVTSLPAVGCSSGCRSQRKAGLCCGSRCPSPEPRARRAGWRRLGRGGGGDALRWGPSGAPWWGRCRLSLTVQPTR